MVAVSTAWAQPKGLALLRTVPPHAAALAQPQPIWLIRAAHPLKLTPGRRLTCCTSSPVEGRTSPPVPTPSTPADSQPLDAATLIDSSGEVHVVSVIPLVTPSIQENGTSNSAGTTGNGANGKHVHEDPELVEGTWSAVAPDEVLHSDIPVVEAYVVDGMPATGPAKPPKSSSKDKSFEAVPDNATIDPEDKATSSTRYAIVLLSQQKPKKSRSKGSKKMLKVLVKASTKFVDLVFSMPTLLLSNQHVFLGALVLLWYILGASLIGEAAGKLATFSPETLQPPGFELVAAMAGFTQSVSDMLMERFAYLFQGWTYANLIVKIPMVLAAAVPLVLALGLLYHKATGTPWEQALLKIHAVVHRQPGANMVSEKTLIGLVLLNLSFFIGMFIVAVLFGLVSDEVKRSFRIIRDGNFPMKTTNHILILNYNQHVVPLLRQLWYGKKYSEDMFFKKPVVILADRSKLDMDEEIAARLKIQSLDVYTRTGNPATTRDLAMVAAGNADTVIVLHPDSSTQEVAEAYKAAIAMALSVAGKVEKQNVVMQMPNELPPAYDFMRSFSKAASACAKRDEHLTPAAGLGAVARMQHLHVPAANVQVLQMPDGNFMDRFTCHATLQPGVFRVWLRILQQGPANVKLRVKNVPAAMSGKTFSDIRRSFRDCVVVGYVKGSDAVFDPLDTQVLQADDKLIMLSYVINPTPGSETNSVYLSAAKAASERMARPATYQVAPRKVIVAGWNVAELQDMVECFADAAPENSQVTFILSKIPEDPSPPSRVGSVRFNYVQSEHPTCLKALTDAGIKQADAVLLGLHEDLPAIEGDALVLAGLLQVQDAVLSSGRPTAPHVVARVQRFGTMQVINQYYASLNTLEGRLAVDPNADVSAAKPSPNYTPLERVKTKFESFGTIPMEVQEQAAAEVLLCSHAAQGAQASAVGGGAGAGLDAAAPGAAGGASAVAQQVGKQAGPGPGEQRQVVPAAAAPVPVNTGSWLMDNLVHNWTATFALTSNVSMPDGDSVAVANAMTSAAGAAAAAAAQAKVACATQASGASKAAAPVVASSSNGSGSNGSVGQSNGAGSGGGMSASSASEAAMAAAVVAAPSMPNPISMAVNAFTKPAEQQAGGSTSTTAVSGNCSTTSSSSNGSGGSGSSAAAASSAANAAAGSTGSTAGGASSTGTINGSAASGTAAAGNGTAGGAGGVGATSGMNTTSASSAASTKPKAPAPPCPIIKDPEVFLSDDISAALLTLVAAHPDVTTLIRKLLTTRQGVELYLRTPALFNLNPGERVTFAEVAEVARLLKQTALGYLKSDGGIILVPEPEHVFTYQEGDQIIVFADDFKKRTSGWGR